jgi:hypothetical protein
MLDCPTCLKEGKHNRLSRDVLTDEHYCLADHKFAGEPAEAVAVAPDPEPARVNAPPPAPPVKPASDDPPQPPSVLTQQGFEVLREAAAKELEDTFGKAMKPEVEVTAGNDRRVTVTIPERDWSGIVALAEENKTSPEQYVQDRIEYGLSNGWFF